jgi:hypothetical protein
VTIVVTPHLRRNRLQPEAHAPGPYMLRDGTPCVSWYCGMPEHTRSAFGSAGPEYMGTRDMLGDLTIPLQEFGNLSGAQRIGAWPFHGLFPSTYRSGGVNYGARFSAPANFPNRDRRYTWLLKFGAFTSLLWIYLHDNDPLNFPDAYALCGYYYWSSKRGHRLVYNNATEDFEAQFLDASIYTVGTTSKISSFPTNEWLLFAMTYDGSSTGRLAVVDKDGTLHNNTTGGASVNNISAQILQFGGSWSSSDFPAMFSPGLYSLIFRELNIYEIRDAAQNPYDFMGSFGTPMMSNNAPFLPPVTDPALDPKAKFLRNQTEPSYIRGTNSLALSPTRIQTVQGERFVVKTDPARGQRRRIEGPNETQRRIIRNG